MGRRLVLSHVDLELEFGLPAHRVRPPAHQQRHQRLTNTLGFFTGSCLLTVLTTEHNPSYVEGFGANGACAQLASFSHDVFSVPTF